MSVLNFLGIGKYLGRAHDRGQAGMTDFSWLSSVVQSNSLTEFCFIILLSLCHFEFEFPPKITCSEVIYRSKYYI
jgi:hypothetical protein